MHYYCSFIAVDCDELPRIPNGQVIVRSTKFGSIATYKCDRGYEFASGEESSYKRTCQSDKTWSGATRPYINMSM